MRQQQVTQALMRLTEREGPAAASTLLDEVFFAATDALPEGEAIERLADRLAGQLIQGGGVTARQVVLAVGFLLAEQGPPGPRRNGG